MSRRRFPSFAVIERPLIFNASLPGAYFFLGRSVAIGCPTMSCASSSLLLSLAGTVTIVFPFLKIVILWARSLASISLCVIKITVFPCSASVLMTVPRCSASCGASTAVGSSRIRTLAPRYSALMISTLCWLPTGRSHTFAFGSTSSPYISDNFRISSDASSRSRNGSLRECLPSTRFSTTLSSGISIKCW